jgi:tRNA 5-methylaminomethyl-2-thiouridine biosynthesis bifunctional protein
LCELLLDHPAIELATNRPLTNLATAAESGPVVLACGAATRDFPETRYLEVAPVAGQLDRIRLANQPRLPIVGSGYLVPGPDHLTVGATYEYEDWDPAAASAANLKQLGNREFEWLGRARGVRAVASDRTPVVGQLAALNGTSVSNVYVSAGHGSAGTVTSHFAATLLVELLGGDFAAMTEPLIDLMSPARFRRRQALRGYRQGAEP